MTAPPSATTAFLMTDIEGSSRLWETHPEVMRGVIAEHDRHLRNAIALHNGRIFATAGDSIAAAFSVASHAVEAAVAAQLAVSDLTAEGEPVRVRMAVHAGVAEERDGDYFGQVLNRCGRLRDAAHGGQVIVSRTVQQLLVGGASDGIEQIDLGEHRLRDLDKPEWIFQLAYPGMQASFPSLRTLTTATTNFPIQLTSFVGRDQDLEEVAKLVRGSRLVTLTGVGGSGKTRLAMQTAAAMASEFTAGVWLADLAPISESELVVQQLADVFGVRGEADRSLLSRLIDHLRSRQSLLVLDNCEHLIDAACQLIEELLGSSQSLRILATSRESLHLPGEVAYSVPPLGIPPSGQSVDLEAAGRFDAVRLFITRAESAQTGFRLTSETAVAVLEICRRLDGIPLAIELAASRLASFTPQQIASNLDHRFRLLTGGRRGGLPRHATLLATIEWSYALLNDLERLLFLRLGVFRGDFSLEAAQWIVTGEGKDEIDLLEMLPRLIDKSLVVAEPAQGEMRYRLLETLRQYASELWQDIGERRAVEAHHAMYFLGLAEESAENLRGAKHEEWMRRLKAEHDNLRQALRWSLDGGEIETGMRIAGALYRFWLHDNNNSEGAWWLQAFVARRETVPDFVRARALMGYGVLAAAVPGQLASGGAALREAVELYRSMDQVPSVRLDYAAALHNLGSYLEDKGETAEAEAGYEEALEISRALGVQWGVSTTLENLGRLAVLNGRIEQARQRFEESVDEARRLGSPRRLGGSLAGKGTFEREHGDIDDAVAAYEESIEVYTRAAYIPGVRWSNVDLAIAFLRRDELDRAKDLFLPNAKALLDDETVLNQSFLMVDLALGRAEIDLASGEPERAATLFGYISHTVGSSLDNAERLEHVKAEIGQMEPAQADRASHRGRAMDLEQICELIAGNQVHLNPP